MEKNGTYWLDRQGRAWIARNGSVTMIGATKAKHIEQDFEEMRYLYELLPA